MDESLIAGHARAISISFGRKFYRVAHRAICYIFLLSFFLSRLADGISPSKVTRKEEKEQLRSGYYSLEFYDRAAASRSFYDATLSLVLSSPPRSSLPPLFPFFLRSIVVAIRPRATGPVIIVASPDLHLLPFFFSQSLLSATLSVSPPVVSLTASLVPLPFTTVLIYTTRYARTSRCFAVLPGIRRI